jgi:anti-sigma factor RsiW
VTLQHPHADLSAYIDGALDPTARAAVDGHLVTCAVCRAHVAQLRATAAFVRALPDPVPSRRLTPRLATPPAWLAPLRTLMAFASGAAVFLFIASSLLVNLPRLAGSGAATTALESRDRVQMPAAQPASVPSAPPVPSATPNPAFQAGPTAASSTLDAARGAATPNEAQKRVGQTTAEPSVAPGAALSPQDAPARYTNAAPQGSGLLSPWLWLALALICGAIAIVLNRRLRTSI